ncbi:MAG: DUF2911 domain-containing protein [Bacteroidota bacterium]
MKHLITLFITAIAVAGTAVAQISTPAPSPKAMVMQTVGLTDITVEYSRPSVKGRTIFAADGLVPYGKIWRTGANQATKITFSDDVMIEDQKLTAGTYSILTMPGAKEWAVHFYTYDKASWSSYVEQEPAVAVQVPSIAMSEKIESFMIGVDEITMEGAVLYIGWENTFVPVKIGVEVKERVMADIERVMNGPSMNDYFGAASFIHDAGGDLNTALSYIQKATKVDNPRFWMVRRESLILADLGRKAEAIAAAKLSLELAKAAGNDDYVALNEKSLKEWSM